MSDRATDLAAKVVVTCGLSLVSIAFVSTLVWCVTSPEYRAGRKAIHETAGLPLPPSQTSDAVIVVERASFWPGPRDAVREFFGQDRARRWLGDASRSRISRVRRIAALMLLTRVHGERAVFRAFIWTVPMGNADGRAVVGLPSAAEAYFHVNINALDLPKAATLAGIIRSPSMLSPIRYPDRAVACRDFVLAIMRERGMIDDNAYRKAVSSPLGAAARLLAEARIR